MLTFSCCRFIQELITHLGRRCQESFPFVLKMWRLAPEVVAVIECDGKLELESVIYFNSSSWSRTRPQPEPIERVYEAPHCLDAICSYHAMNPIEMRALAMAELRTKSRQDFYPQPLSMNVPEPLRARVGPQHKDRLVPCRLDAIVLSW